MCDTKYGIVGANGLIAELSLRTTRHTTCCTYVISALCAARDFHTIAHGHFSVRVRDSSRRSEKIVKKKKKRRFSPFNVITILIIVSPIQTCCQKALGTTTNHLISSAVLQPVKQNIFPFPSCLPFEEAVMRVLCPWLPTR